MHFVLFILFSLTIFVSSYKPRICKNCKHFIPSKLGDSFAKCSLFEKTGSNEINYLVTGEKIIEFNYCSSARHDNTSCGVRGTHYKPVYPLKSLKPEA